MTDTPSGNAHPSPRDLLITGFLAAAVTLAAVLVYYGPSIATGRELFFTHDIGGSDIWHLNYPMKAFYQQELEAGRLPLWCPDIGTGFPLHAEGQVAALYPLNLLLYKVLPLALAFNWGMLLHAVLSGAFAAAFARQLGAGRGGSVLAALVFAFSGFFVTHLKHINMTASAVWIPLLLLLLERYARNRSRGTLALFAAAVAAMILAGHPQIVYNNLLVAGGYALYLLVAVWRRRPVAGGGRGPAGRFAGGLLYAVILGVLLGLPQLLPTQELNKLGPRQGGMSVQAATEWEYHPKFLLGFLWPGAFGDPGVLEEVPATDPRTGAGQRGPDGKPIMTLRGFDPGGVQMLYWEMTGYVGILPLLLAALAVAFGFRRAALWRLLVFLGLTLLLTLGTHGGLFHLFYHLVPGFSLFRFHDRFLLYVDLFLAVLAGLGLTWALARVSARPRRALAVTAAVLASIIAFTDLYLALGHHNPRIEASRWTAAPESVQKIRQDAGPKPAPFRVADHDAGRTVFTNAYYRARGWVGDLTPYDVARNMLDPNLNLLYHIDHLQIYFQLRPRWMTEASGLLYDPRTVERIADLYNVRYLLVPRGPTYDAIPGQNRAHPTVARLAQLTAAGHFTEIASFAGDAIQGMQMVDRQTGALSHPTFHIQLLRNNQARSRAFLVPRARVLTEQQVPEGRLTPGQMALLDPGFDPGREVLLHRAPTDPSFLGGHPGDPIPDPVEFADYQPQRVELAVTAPRDAWLVLSDTFYPGWTATVDDQATPIHRANISGRAIEVKAGKHQVVFTYRPTGWLVAVIGALLGLVLLCTLPLQARIVRKITARATGGAKG